MVKNGEETAKKRGEDDRKCLTCFTGNGDRIGFASAADSAGGGPDLERCFTCLHCGNESDHCGGALRLGGRPSCGEQGKWGIPAHGKRSRRPSLPHLGIGLPGNHWNRGVSWAVCGNPTDDIGWRLFGWANGEEEAEEKEAIKNDEDCKKAERALDRKKETEQKNRDTVLLILSVGFLVGGRIGVPAGGKTVHRALYRSVFPAGSTNVHCAVSVA